LFLYNYIAGIWFCFLTYRFQYITRVSVTLNIAYDITTRVVLLATLVYILVHRSEMDLNCLWIVFLMKIVTGMFVCSLTSFYVFHLYLECNIWFNDTRQLCFAWRHKRLTYKWIIIKNYILLPYIYLKATAYFLKYYIYFICLVI